MYIYYVVVIDMGDEGSITHEMHAFALGLLVPSVHTLYFLILFYYYNVILVF